MTAQEFISSIFGTNWNDNDLPIFLGFIKDMELNSRRYYVVRDFAIELKLGYDARDRKNFHQIDDVVDAKLYDIAQD